jgi:protoporphyrinogen oxidase
MMMNSMMMKMKSSKSSKSLLKVLMKMTKKSWTTKQKPNSSLTMRMQLGTNYYLRLLSMLKKSN